jgi:low affinity Fe/Cu permease
MEGKSWYSKFAKAASKFCGKPIVFALAVAAIVIWIVSGPMFGFSDTWQLVINTATTIVTFLMVFLIQSTQNRDTEALHIKLDELIRATQGAHNTLMDLEEMEETKLDRVKQAYSSIAREARENGGHGADTDTPEVSHDHREDD